MIFLIRTYLWTVLVFIIAKVGFMLVCGRIANPAEQAELRIADMWQVVWHGLTLDLSTALYIIIIPFLVTLISLWTNKLLRSILYVYYIIISFAFALAFVADTSLYPFWGFKLDATCLQYIDTPTEAMASVSVSYLMWRLIALIVIALIILRGYLTVLRQQIQCIYSSNSVNLVSKFTEFTFYLLLTPLIVIGIRGGFGESTTNIGQVYYSQNQFLNHAAVNPVFSFFASFERTANMNATYHFMDDTACEAIISQLYNWPDCKSVLTGDDTLLTNRTPNIIIILLESCGGMFTEISGRTDITPNLNRLAHEGIYFTNCIANSWRTDRGTVCTWSGYPSFPTMSVMKMPSKSRSLPNIAKTLVEERGYTTSYLYGGDINFTNMRSYLVSGGFQTLTWKADYTSEQQATAKWGVRDDITVETLYQQCHTLPQPFLIGYSTLSSHAPWDVPTKHFDDEVVNSFYYLDQCIGTFIEKLRKSEVWDNTLIVMLADHGIPYNVPDRNGPLVNHIPMIWTGGAVKEPRRIEQVCNQTDLAATLLGQMGISHDDYIFSRDVMSKTYTRPFAINTYDDGYAMYDSVSFVNYDLVSNRVITQEGRENPELILRGKAILQAASKDLEGL